MTDDAPAIRPVRSDDATALAAVTARAYEAAYRGIVPDPVLDEWIAGARAFWDEGLPRLTMPDQPSRAWVAEREGRIVGYATTSAGKDWWLPPPDGAGELTNLYLDPDVIGSGVGGRLYRHAVADLRERGFNPLVVWAFRDNPRAIGFYEAMGLAIDVAEHTWELGGVACPIVRFRADWS
jgi:ribosomal protein S18 acetylase RimI-like enzyme